MEDLIFVTAQPDVPYFHWQVRVYVHNFINMGINPNNIHVIFSMVNGVSSPSEQTLKLKGLGINVHHYYDDRENKQYIPSLRPLILSKWLKDYPELSKNYFYHDSDIVFRKLPNFDLLLNDNIIYLSDTNSYINYDYVSNCSKNYSNNYEHLQSDDLLKLMSTTIGVSVQQIEMNNNHSGGAQYLIKNLGFEFWEKVYKDCVNLYYNIWSFDKSYPINYGGLQIWTADMWALLWNLWLFGKETLISDELSFSWASDDIEEYYKHNILHMAGVTDKFKGVKFYKGEFINVNPLDKLRENENYFRYVNKNSTTIKYVEIMKTLVKKEP
jgi:hypothetical protein